MPLFTSSSPCRKDQFAVSYFSKFKNEAVRNCCHPLEGGAGEGGWSKLCIYFVYDLNSNVRCRKSIW